MYLRLAALFSIAFCLGFCLLLVCGIYWIPCVSVWKSVFKSRVLLEFHLELQGTSLHLLWKFLWYSTRTILSINRKRDFWMQLQKIPPYPVWRVQIKLEDLATFTAELDSTPELNPTEVVLGCSVCEQMDCTKFCGFALSLWKILSSCGSAVLFSDIEIVSHNPVWSFLGTKYSIL